MNSVSYHSDQPVLPREYALECVLRRAISHMDDAARDSRVRFSSSREIGVQIQMMMTCSGRGIPCRYNLETRDLETNGNVRPHHLGFRGGLGDDSGS